MSTQREQSELVRLLNEARQGSEEAARKLHEQYREAVFAAVRHRLSNRARVQFDSTDLAQEVWQDFFLKSLWEDHFQSPEALVAFLTKAAENKVAMAHRRLFQLQKNNCEANRRTLGRARTNRAPPPAPVSLEIWGG